MKKYYLTLIIIFSIAANAQVVNIPDASFKSALLAYQPAIDTNGDNQIQAGEALAVTALTIQSPETINDLTGLSSFTNLTSFSMVLFGGTVVDFSALVQLQSLTFTYAYNISALNLSGLTNLATVTCSNSTSMASLNLNGVSGLQTLDCSYNALTALNLSSCPQLISLNCRNNNLPLLNLNGLSQLHTVNCNNNLINSLTLTGATALTYLNCSENAIASLDLAALLNIEVLKCSYNSIASLNLAGKTTLTTLYCDGNYLTSLDFSDTSNMTNLDCSRNLISALSVSNMTQLVAFSCSSNPITTLDVSALAGLTELRCGETQLPSIDLSALIHLQKIDCGSNPFTAIDVSHNPDLTNLYCANDHLTALNLTNQPALKTLYCSGNLLTDLDVSNCPKLVNVSVGDNLFTALDFGYPIQIDPDFGGTIYDVSYSPNLVYLNVKNGLGTNQSGLIVNGCPNLAYICADEFDIPSVLWVLNGQPVNVNSYCSFSPGGTHNTISGTASLDANDNGCDAADPHFQNVKITLNDGVNSGAAFTNPDGGYAFYTNAGNFTMAPAFENPYFTISPTNSNVNFPTIGNLTQTRDFCIAPLGVHHDLEVMLFGNARPGFDNSFTLVYKNKGNQIESGTISLSFDEAILDFISAIPGVDFQSAGNLSWNYTNLQPFESRSISFILNLNGPTETPAVNIGDIVSFTAVVNPVAADETPADNTVVLNQFAIGSFDPNDKTCVEGTTISPDKVGDYLHYVIRFQNSGTAAAANIVVKDILDAAKFDTNSLQLMGSSHPHQTRIAGNKVEFIFENINLPAQSTNESASRGFVAFKIKTKNNLVVGNSVSNTANIYFDYNFPILTNTASTTIALLGNDVFADKSVSVSPNPAKDKITVQAKDKITSIELFDAQGRLIRTEIGIGTPMTFDLSDHATGVYFVKIHTSKGVKTQKIIKE